MTPGVELHVARDVAEVRLVRPERRNALSLELLDQLRTAIQRASSEANVIVLTGSGGVFSAGADLDDLTGTAQDVRIDEAVREVVEVLHTAPVPAIAAVEGPCVGAAITLLLACDLRLAAPEATFRLPAVALGLLYDPAALQRAARRIGVDALRRLLLVPDDPLTARDACHLGIVTDVTDQPVGQARKWARSLAGCDREVISVNVRLLRALETEPGNDDLYPWDQQRRELLTGPARRAAVETIQRERIQRQDSP